MSDYYVAEEQAMAPGIAGDWLRVIPKPDNPNGRLVKVEMRITLRFTRSPRVSFHFKNTMSATRVQPIVPQP